MSPLPTLSCDPQECLPTLPSQCFLRVRTPPSWVMDIHVYSVTCTHTNKDHIWAHLPKCSNRKLHVTGTFTVKWRHRLLSHRYTEVSTHYDFLSHRGKKDDFAEQLSQVFLYWAFCNVSVWEAGSGLRQSHCEAQTGQDKYYIVQTGFNNSWSSCLSLVSAETALLPDL